METTSFDDAMGAAQTHKSRRYFPGKGDARSHSSSLVPAFLPKFPLKFDERLSVFTIGSCFARNIEEVLAPLGVRLPTMAFSAPKSESGGRSNRLLNEYNPGSMCQRILSALEGRPLALDTIVPSGSLHVDLLLHGGGTVTRERAASRRDEIDGIYRHLAAADVVLLTLGLVEAWFDEATKLYLNQLPPPAFAAKEPRRFTFRRLDVSDCMPLLERALDAIAEAGAKILLTVSPVPLAMTFTGDDCVTANEYSKSVLRVCAHRLAQRPNVDYFPSYEIVRSGGLANYVGDHVHVRNDVVEDVTRSMVEAYRAAPAEAKSVPARP